MARGDRLAVERRIAGSTLVYTHHGIDIGDGTVVHARPDDPRRWFAGGCVDRTTYEDFAAGAAVRVIVDPPARYSPDEVAARALGLVGRDGYCPVVENCEHFATWCATGDRRSRQVELLAGRLDTAAARLAAVVASRAAGRVAVRAGGRTAVRLGLRTLLPATLVAEGAAMAAEWSSCQAGHSAETSRIAGESAGMFASAAVCAAGAAVAGPAALVGGAIAGAAMWVTGSVAAEAVTRACRGPSHPASQGRGHSPRPDRSP